MIILRRLRLFLKIVFREWESKGGIPEPYRLKYRLTPKIAWEIACLVHEFNATHKP